MVSRSLQDWFINRGLPFSEAVSNGLCEFGTDTVEELKLVPEDVFISWFADLPKGKQIKAKLVLEQLKAEKFDATKTATKINLIDASPKPPPQKKPRRRALPNYPSTTRIVMF